jgi:hypothetical protein
MNAAEKLVDLETELERSDSTDSTLGRGSMDLVPACNNSLTLLPRQVSAIATFHNAIGSASDAASRQALVLRLSTQLINDLLHEWTRVFEPEPTYHAQVGVTT